MTHNWKAIRFEDGGQYQGITTCLQAWRCKDCGDEEKLPLGCAPEDYSKTACNGSEPKHSMR
jgi:hypothetical protein